ncbi:MAG: quinoprotein dehydrogenase-associated SoxYZ-like carrier [Geminicoccaceae bacterium]
MKRAVLGLAVAVVAAGAPWSALHAEGSWDAIREELFAGREIKDGTGLIDLDAPKRAQDAATVPMTIKALRPQTAEDHIKTVWLIIDENPAPVAGIFKLLGETGDATLGARVRVNDYTNVHAVAETADGSLYAVEKFVKASGGCSAPSLKDKDAAMARLGQMKLKPQMSYAAGVPNQVQLLISHPNYSGMQMDQMTHFWIPPDYIRFIKVAYAGKPVLEVETDISFSEDPSITFSFVPDAPGSLDVAVEDSKGRKFNQSLAVGPTS